MAKGTANPKAPNRNAPTGDLGVMGRRTNRVVPTGSAMGDDVNDKSSNNTANYREQNQTRSGGKVGKITG